VERSRSLSALRLALPMLLICSAAAFSQVNLGSINGTVTDATGAAIPDARVTATATTTQVKYQAVTDQSGNFSVLSLPTSDYTLSVSHPGFHTYEQRGMLLTAGASVRVDVKLEVGEVTQQVTVTGAPPLLETRSGSLSESVSVNVLTDLPLLLGGSKRDPSIYVATIPGYQAGAGFYNAINGSISAYSELFVDGTPFLINDAVHGVTRNVFSAEAVSELKVIQTPMADYGNAGGNVISYITKSGSNQIHGSAYEYMRNSALDSRCWFCSKVTTDHQNEFGFDVGGPIYIPKVYDGRNKGFFWFNFGESRYFFGVGAPIYSIPIDAWRNGDFSNLLGAQMGTDALGRPILQGQLYDPHSQRVLPDGTIIRDPFPNNHIPNNLWAATSVAFQSHYPEPNRPGIVNNYVGTAGKGSTIDKYWQINWDQTFGPKDKLTVAYWQDSQPTIPANAMPEIFDVSTFSGVYGHLVHVNWTHSFSPNLVNELAIGYDRSVTPLYSPPAAKNGAATIGMVNPVGTCTPSVQMPVYFGTTRGDAFCYQVEADTNYTLYETVSRSSGKHITKFGGDFVRWDANFVQMWNSVDTFLPSQTGLPGFLSNTGHQYAGFLLGAVDYSQAHGPDLSAPRSLQYGFFVQDEYRMTPKLTLTGGLRYDVQPFPVHVHNAVSQFCATCPNPGAGNIPGALTFLGFGPGTLNTRKVPPTYWYKTNFGPKVGFAYQVNHDTVIRGAWTLAYGPPNQTIAGFTEEYQQGYFPLFSSTSQDGFTPAFYWQNGFPYPVPNSKWYNNFDPTIANGSNTGFFGPDADKAPRVQNIHFGIQHMLPRNVLLETAYNGVYVHGLIDAAHGPINGLNYHQYGSLGNLLYDDINSAAARAANIPIPYPGFQGSVAQALRPFPQFQDIENQSAVASWSTYSAFQVTLKKEFSSGSSFLVGYTIEKQLTNINTVPGFFASSPQDAYNMRAEKAPAFTDIPQQLLFNYTYELPVGPGKRFLNKNNVLNKHVLGGWRIAGYHTYQSGGVLGAYTERTLPTLPGLWGVTLLRPDIVQGVPIRTSGGCGSFNPATDRYLNVKAFVDPRPFQFGSAPRAFGNVRACGLLNENISLFKSVSIEAKAKIDLGFDFFDAFNRHQWGSPAADVDNPGAFGAITNTANGPRLIQAHLRIRW
jgi:hypothetical protein